MIRALIVIFGGVSLLAAEADSRMVPPANPIRGKLPSVPPTASRNAAKTFRVLDGFRMDLLAAEPMVASPVAMAYDENGRAYVCEMRDYPYTDKARHQRNQENPTDQAIGVVRLLEDIDGDGVFDKSMEFAEGLSWPTGVACWKGGVFVAATPDIWYLKDTNGDGKADVRRKVFTGFRKLNVQSVMNNLVWGLDNRIYGAGGSNGGQIRHADRPDEKPMVMSRNDFRFDPVTEEFEVLSGGARFGGTFDDWGHRFLCDIRNPAQHIVLPLRYLTRNPFLAAGSVLNDMAEFGDQLPVHRVSAPEEWRVLRAKRWAGERDIIMPRSELVGAGVVTSSSGITCYRGDAYPKEYYGSVFVCESAGNLFYRLKLTPDGPSFKATHANTNAEMVASKDNWFRPVNFVNAPDGTLHVMDMYRENIEHPWSIPDDIHAAVDLESGRERGRIWRLTPPNFKTRKAPRLGNATTTELVATLENPNSWWRETAQRLLFERQDRSAVEALRKMARRGGKSATARLHALWTLEGLGELNDGDVGYGVRDRAAGVRENAVKLGERRIASADVREDLLACAADADTGVRLQLAFTYGEIGGRQAAVALVTIAERDGANPWIRTAILSSAGGLEDQLLARFQEHQSEHLSELIRELAKMVGSRGKVEEMQRVVASVNGSLRDVGTGLGEGLKRSGKNLRAISWDKPAYLRITALLSQAAETAMAADASIELRVAGIRLVAFDEFERAHETLAALLESKQSQEVQLAAVAAVSGFNRPEATQLLLSKWSGSAPAIRSEIIMALLGSRVRSMVLLEAIEAGRIPANQIPFARRANLLRSSDARVKELAGKFFSAPGSRQEAVAKYQSALAIKGDAERGRKVFENSCATCHIAGNFGKDVGPNLATVRQWNPEQLLINILDPNWEVAPNFLGYTVETREGRSIDGIIASENPASVTLKKADGLTEAALRGDIVKISGSGLSLMPEGLEGAITPEQMADLIAFLLLPP